MKRSLLLIALLFLTACQPKTPEKTSPSTGNNEVTVVALLASEGSSGTFLITKPLGEFLDIGLDKDMGAIGVGDSFTMTLSDMRKESYPAQTDGTNVERVSVGKDMPVHLRLDINTGASIAAYGKEALLVDVRTPEEYAGGHLPGAINKPVETHLGDLEKEMANKDAAIFVYCRSGNRSNTAAKALIKKGFPLVIDLGGISGFKGELEK